MKSIAEAAKLKVKQESLSKSEFQPNSRILVVDDEREILKSFCDILASSQRDNVLPMRSSRSQVSSKSELSKNYEVVTASNYDEALAFVKRSVQKNKPFAMGFFDVLLGEGPDGFDLVKEIQSLDSRIYSVFVTAYNDRSIESIQKFLGEDRSSRWDYLNKPFSHGEIAQKAKNFVSLWNLNEEKLIQDAKVKEAQRRLLESEKLTSVAAVARGVSHEFGNLLMQIMGKADVALSQDDPEKLKASMQVILDATQRANDILEKFKNLSNPSLQTGEKSFVYLHEILEEVLLLMEHQLKKENVKVSRVKTDAVQVELYPTSILQVFVNLTINAVHAMGNSGQIDFKISDLGSEAEIRVRDYGPGIRDQDLDKIFEAFYTTKGSQGSGLGLPICKEIVEIEHGGSLKIQNHGVKGLEAIITLPKKGERR